MSPRADAEGEALGDEKLRPAEPAAAVTTAQWNVSEGRRRRRGPRRRKAAAGGAGSSGYDGSMECLRGPTRKARPSETKSCGRRSLHARNDVARTDGVRADAVRRSLGGEELGDRDHAGLRDGVRGDLVHGPKTGVGGDVDHRAAPLLAHRLEARPRDPEERGE